MRPKVYFSDKIKLIGTEQGIPYHDALILVLCDYYEEKARQVCKRAKADFDEVYKKDSGKIEFRAAAISESFGNLNTLEDLNRDIEMFVREDIEEENMTEENNQEQGLKCPICGKKLEDNFFEYHCDNCKFKVQHVISGTKIEDEELQKIFAGEVSQVHEFTSAKTGNTYKAKLRLSADKLKVDMVYDWDSGLKCPKCGKKIMESGKGFFCEGGDFKCWREISGTEISREELQKALEGQGDELGFRSHKTGKTFLARLVLNEAKDGLEFKFAERKSEDTGLKCPHCGKKILETDKGFFCEDRDFKCWKSTRGAEISREELQKILEGQGDELDFVGKSSGKPYKGRLVLNDAKDGLDFEFADKKDGLSGSELTDIARDGGSGAGEGQ